MDKEQRIEEIFDNNDNWEPSIYCDRGCLKPKVRQMISQIKGDNEGLLTEIDIPQVFPQKRCISQAYANGWNDCRNTANKKIKAQRDLTRQERDAEITKLKEESEARRELIRRLTDKGLALIAEGQERLDRPELREKIDRILDEEPPNGACTKEVEGCPKVKTCKECARNQILALIPEEEIRKKVKAIQNPYIAEFFPRDDKWAGQILREKGLTDDEIGGVSGALGRIAFEYIMAEIDRLFEP